MRILLIIWIAVMVYWQFFTMNFLFQEAKFSPLEVHLPIFWGSCSNLELMQILLIIWIAVMVHCSIYNKFCISGKKLFSPSMKAIVRTCACAISLDHLDFSLFMFGSHSYSKSGWIHFQIYFETEVHLLFFHSNSELMWILFIIWIAVMVYWQYFMRKILFQKVNFSPHL